MRYAALINRLRETRFHHCVLICFDMPEILIFFHRYKMTEENQSQMNSFIRNQGFQHIPTLIFECLSLESFAVCRKVSKEWKQFIDHSTSFWKRHLQNTRELMKEKQDYHNRSKNYEDEEESEDGEKVFWKSWTQVFNHYEFEVKDNDLVKDFVLLFYDYWKEHGDYHYDWTTPLNQAAKRGTNLHLVNYCIQNGFDFRCNIKCFPPLHNACQFGQKDVMEIILKHLDELKIDISAPEHDWTEDGGTIFHCLCKSDNFNEEILKTFLEFAKDRKFDFNLKNGSSGKSGFYLSIGHPETVKLLFKYHDLIHLDVNARDNVGRTPLQWACVIGDLQSVKIILTESKKYGLDLDINAAPPHSGDSPLHVATAERYDPHSLSNPYQCNDPNVLFKVLVKYAGNRLNFFAPNNAGRIPVKGNVIEYIEYCEANETEVDFKQTDKFGKNVLHLALENEKALQRLFDYLDSHQKQIDMNVQDKNRQSPLLSAVTSNNLEAVKLLLNYCHQRKVILDLAGRDGSTVFHLCNITTLELLLHHFKQIGIKINLNLRNKNGLTPFHMACHRGQNEKVQYLLSLTNTIFVDVNCKDNQGKTPSYLACQSGDMDTVMTLLNHSFTRGINFNAQDDNGFTALHQLCKTGEQLLIIEVLLRLSMNYCIDVNIVDKEGKTPFHLACEFGEVKVVELFIDCYNPGGRICLEAQDMNGMTPLHLACKNKHSEVVEKLLRNSTVKKYLNAEIPDINGLTPKQHADHKIANMFEN